MTTINTADGLQRLIDLLTMLDDKGIHYQLDRQSPDAVMASLSLIGARVEIEFFVDRIEYSVFKGNEDVASDLPALLKLIDEHWSE